MPFQTMLLSQAPVVVRSSKMATSAPPRAETMLLYQRTPSVSWLVNVPLVAALAVVLRVRRLPHAVLLRTTMLSLLVITTAAPALLRKRLFSTRVAGR